MSDNAPVGFSFAKIDWHGQHPYASIFEDGYYALSDDYHQVDALSECQYVFLDANNLAQRFAAVNSGETFTIAETGFGTGLNFLATCEVWQRNAKPDARLEYISIEKYPLHYADMQRMLHQYAQNWPQLNNFCEALDKQYHNLVPLIQSWFFEQFNINLHLIIEDINHALKRYNFKANAWFLDGFAPSKNVEMWHPDVLQKIALHSQNQTTLSSFTAAGAVKRALKANGFSLHKRSGFAGKREMIHATFYQEEEKKQEKRIMPWRFYRPNKMKHNSNNKKFLILGAGVSGSVLAHELSDIADIQVWDPALSNRQYTGNCPAYAISYSRLYAKDILLNQWNLQSYSHFLHNISTLADNHRQQIWHDTGLLQLYRNTQASKRFQALLDAGTMKGIADVNCDNNSITLTAGGFVKTRALIDYYLAGDNIQTHAKSVDNIKLLDTNYEVSDGYNVYDFDAVFIACGHRSLDLLKLIELTSGERPFISQENEIFKKTFAFNKVKGQETVIRFKSPHNIKQVVCDNVYAIPVDEYTLAIGAGFYRNNTDTQIAYDLHEENIRHASNMLDLSKRQWSSAEVIHGFSGIRYYTNDYLPYFGHCILPHEFYKTYQHGLSKDRKFYFDDDSIDAVNQCLLQNLYLFTAMGARGISSGALAAKKIKQQIVNPDTVSGLLDDALHPARFLVRAIYKHEI